MNRLYISDLVPGPHGSLVPAIDGLITQLGLAPATGQYLYVVAPDDGAAKPWCVCRVDITNHAPLVALDATNDTFKLLPVGFPRDVKLSAMGGVSRRQLDRAMTKLGLATLLDDTTQTWGAVFTTLVRQLQPNYNQDDADGFQINT